MKNEHTRSRAGKGYHGYRTALELVTELSLVGESKTHFSNHSPNCKLHWPADIRLLFLMYENMAAFNTASG